VTADEVAGLRAVVDATVNSASEPGDAAAKTQQGIRLALQAVLLSPHFLYRPELDPDPSGTVRRPLNGYELASRLSYFLWNTMPDDELFARAADGTLTKPDTLPLQVDRMLADPKAAGFTESFVGQWLELRLVSTVSPDTTLFPKFDDGIRNAMAAETRTFFAEFLKPGHAFPDMLDAPFTFVNQNLATYYGLSATGLTGDVSRVSLEGSQRLGLLSQGSFLMVTSHANRTSPVLRGKFVLKQLLCTPPPPPPNNVPPFNEDTSAGTVRERLEAHRAGACAVCHKPMDPIGFALENFDAAGQYRTTDGGQPIDKSGLVVRGHDVSDLTSLAAVVKADPGFAPCVVRNLYSYGVGHEAGPSEEGSLKALAGATVAAGNDFTKLIHSLVSTDAFLTHQGARP
jgi:hypothetical protein